MAYAADAAGFRTRGPATSRTTAAKKTGCGHRTCLGVHSATMYPAQACSMPPIGGAGVLVWRAHRRPYAYATPFIGSSSLPECEQDK